MTAPARPDLLFALPSIAADRIAAAMPGLRTCIGFSGRLTVARLKEHAVAAPAVLVVRLGAVQSQTYAGPARTWTVRMAAFVVTKDMLGAEGRRDEQAGRIAQVLLGLIPETTWGLDGFVGAAERLSEEPLITEDSEKAATALHVITWQHEVSLGWQDDAAPINPEVWLGYAPDIGAAHEDDYDLVAGGGA
jgi:hypothetical protein